MHTQNLSVHALARAATALALALSASAASAQPAPAPSPAPILQSVLDPTVNACDDFYRRACGGFIASTKLTPGRPSVELANQQFEANLEHSFQKLFAQDVSHDPELARLKTFYTSCMANTPADTALVKDWLARIDAAQTPAQIQDLMLELSAIGVEPFFTYTGQPNRQQWDHYRGEIHNAFIWANAETVVRTFRTAGLPEDQAQRDAATVVAMVTALRKARGDRYDPSTAENPRTPAALAQLAPSVDWKRYLHMVGAPLDRSVNVTAPGFLTAVEKELATRTPAELRAYLRWMYLFSLRGELPAPYNAAFGDISPGLRVQLENPAGRCRDATVRAMGVEFSRQYATRVLGLPARDAARKIAAEIKTRLVASVADAQWLSPAGRAATTHKLQQADLKIGFPDQWPAVGHYALDSHAFLANVLAARRYEQRREWARPGTPRNRAAWEMIVSPWVGDGMAAARLVVPNGFPDAFSNSVIMTAAFLGAPRFDGDAAPELNYATFGSVFAHEFVHVAETHEFGADGSVQELWSAADIKAEEAAGQCVVAQANAWEPLPGVKMKGERQYGENVADYGGLRLAFEALEKRLGTDALYRVDASGTSPAQRFFYKYAQYRCTAQTDEDLRKTVESDGHAPVAFRVNAPLSNLPGFARAFSCQPGAKMARPPEQQCRVW